MDIELVANVTQSALIVMLVLVLFISFYEGEPPFWVKAASVIPMLLSALIAIIGTLILVWS